MKRGITINLLALFILLVLFALPWIALLATQQVADARGCQLTPVPGQSETCQSLSSLTLLIGYGMIAYYPVVAAIAGLYLLGLGVFCLVSLARSRQSGQPFSPAALGMIYSTLAVLAVAGLLAAIAVAINWYRVYYVNACRGLPGRPEANGRQNGPLALGVRLPYPQGRPEQFVIWSLDPQGGAPATLAKLPASKDPAWSADGREIAFVAGTPEAGWDIYHLPASGGEAQSLLHSDLEMRQPAWFPDSARLLFDRPLESSPDPQIDLFTLTVGVSKPTVLVSGSKYDGDGRVSPDGQQVVFTSLRNGRSDVYRVNADGSGLRRLTLNPAWDGNPAWSPDGKWIVFASSRDSASGRTNYALYSMSPDGRNQCRLTEMPGSQVRPVWSADGQWIAFISVLDDKLYRIRPDGTDLTPIPVDAEVEALLSLDWAVTP
jgi:TolB protein